VKIWWDATGKKFFTDLPTNIYNLVKTLWDFWWKPLAIVWLKVTGWWDVTGKKFFTDLPGKVLAAAKGIWDFFNTALASAWKTVQSTWTTITTTVGGWVTSWKKTLSGLWDGLFSGLKTAWGSVRDWWNKNVAGKGFEVGGGLIPKVTLKIPPIPLAEGGVVGARPGGTLARIGEAGRAERVEPLDKDGLSKRDRAIITLLSGGGGGPTFHIYPSQGMDERELAQIINRELAFSMRKGAA
jgi:hypothetical protein